MKKLEKQQSSSRFQSLSDDDLLQTTGGVNHGEIVSTSSKTDEERYGFLWLNKKVNTETKRTYADGHTTTIHDTHDIKVI